MKKSRLIAGKELYVYFLIYIFFYSFDKIFVENVIGDNYKITQSVCVVSYIVLSYALSMYITGYLYDNIIKKDTKLYFYFHEKPIRYNIHTAINIIVDWEYNFLYSAARGYNNNLDIMTKYLLYTNKTKNTHVLISYFHNFVRNKRIFYNQIERSKFCTLMILIGELLDNHLDGNTYYNYHGHGFLKFLDVCNFEDFFNDVAVHIHDESLFNSKYVLLETRLKILGIKPKLREYSVIQAHISNMSYPNIIPTVGSNGSYILVNQYKEMQVAYQLKDIKQYKSFYSELFFGVDI
jgi:hypothetical protein